MQNTESSDTEDYVSVTELSGDEVSDEQVERLFHRYIWAGDYCKGKDVVEAGCGTGQGVGYLSSIAKSVEVGDFSESILNIARQHYGDRFEFLQFDAMDMPFADQSKDVILLYEAIYYVPDAKRFVSECKRILRPGGKVLIATANRDLFDFNPSPHSFEYYGVRELNALFANEGFSSVFYGYLQVTKVSARQKILRPIKQMAVKLNLMPKTMAGKKFLKSIMFGKLVQMPAEIAANDRPYIAPTALSGTEPDRDHKVIYCAASLPLGEN